MLRIGKVTVEGLLAREYAEELPEIYALEQVVENNAWHPQQDVLDHTIGVYRGMNSVLEMFELSAFQKQLDSWVGVYNRRDILLISALLHDRGKAHSLTTDALGTTSCPWHEEIGAALVPSMSERFGMYESDCALVKRIISLHGFCYGAFTLAKNNGNPDLYLGFLRALSDDCYHELLLLHYADMVGGVTPPEQFDYRRDLILAEFAK